MPIYSPEQWEAELIASYGRWLRFARRLTGSNTDGEDLLHEVMEAMTTRARRGALNVDGSLNAYVHSALRKRVISHRQGQAKVVPAGVEILIESCDDELRSEIFGPELAELMALLSSTLGTRQVLALTMHDVLGYTYKEISQLTAIGSPSTVHLCRTKAVEAIRTWYDNGGSGDSDKDAVVLHAGVGRGFAAATPTAGSGEQFMQADTEEI